MPTLTGTSGDDSLSGTADDDMISGLGGDDVLLGLAGDDTLIGGIGRNYLDGGTGDDTVSYRDATAAVTVSLAVTNYQDTGYSTDHLVSINRLIGSSLYGDILTGSAGDDYIDPGPFLGNSGPFNRYSIYNANDRVFAGGGNDIIVANGVTNGSIFNGESGDDTISVGFSGSFYVGVGSSYTAVDGIAVQIYGGDGRDTISALSHAFIDGGAGDDYIRVGTGAVNFLDLRRTGHIVPVGTDNTVHLTGGLGADTFAIWNPVGTAIVSDFSIGNDLIDLSGSTFITALPSYGRVYIAQQGSDTVFYSSDNPDIVYGRLLNVRASAIPVSSFLNNASVAGAPGGIVDTSVIGVYGSDASDSLSGANRICGGAGDDTITGLSTASALNGGDGNDIIRGSIAADNLDGDGGDDLLIGGLGDDFLSGGLGFDTVDYSAAAGGVSVNLGTRVAVGAAGNDRIDGIEGVIGSSFDDYLTGSANSDTLRGGRGLDTLVGAAGADTFVFAVGDSTSSAIDSISDFSSGSDRLVIEGGGDTVGIVRTSNGGTLVFVDHPGRTQSVIGVNGTIQASDVYSSLQVNFRTVMTGSDGSDVLIGGAFADTLLGGAGVDFLTGGGGADTLTGGAGGDVFFYRAGSESSQTASDTITDFVSGTDRIDLGGMNPTSVSIARVAGGGSVVFAETASGAFQLFVQGAALNASDFALSGPIGIYVIGSEEADSIVGGSLPDPLVGNGGNDVITGGAGADAIAGGAGNDVFRYVSRADSNQQNGFDNLYDFATGEDRIDLSLLNATSISVLRTDNGSSFIYAETAQGVFLTTAANRTVQATDIAYGNGFGIYMVGSGVADTLVGTSLADPIAGGAGNDTITGGGGADAMFGDGGADTFVYRLASDSTAAASDGIFGFVSGEDRIDLRQVRTGSADTFGIAYLSGGSFLFVDLGGNGTSDLVIGLANTTLLAGDIIWGPAAIAEEPAAKVTDPEVLPVEGDDILEGVSVVGDLSGHTGRFMLDLDPNIGRGFYHGQDWYL